ncbi:esterase/lipase family protein [Corynebacterium heidelbergense]|uniref:esterase/lipase family protein n=1 Tax=Corynebacterium heidelbergense TaxID=2055947 RepID=UPI0011BD6402|nr:hypothetical protein [Corynebacterium heidelbergense]
MSVVLWAGALSQGPSAVAGPADSSAPAAPNASGALPSTTASTADGSAQGSSLFAPPPPARPNVASAPQSGTGPALTVPEQELAKTMKCNGDLSKGPDPLLLIHGTLSTVDATFSWSWLPSLEMEKRPWCTVELPKSGVEDIQISAEYVTYAIREMHKRAGRRIDIVGHSQGGMIGRWSTKWWPDTRGMIDDLVGIAPTNKGTAGFYPACATLGCGAGTAQQGRDANFIHALNEDAMTFPEIDYTTINSTFDELVVPYTNGFLPSGPNVSNLVVQDYCTAEPIDHFLIIVSNAAYVLAKQALDNDGPNEAPGMAPSECLRLMPGVNLLTFPFDGLSAVGHSVQVALFGPKVPGEPALRPYAEASPPSP